MCGHTVWIGPMRDGLWACRSCGAVSRTNPAAKRAAPALLTVEDSGKLRMAGRWGLLRPQSGRRFMATGLLSLPVGDLRMLLEAAGGRLDPSASLEAGTVDVVLAGEEASKALVEKALDRCVPVWDEAELVANLLPTIDSLEAAPAEAPF